MKGVSLSINVVIILALAVIVLVALFLFFTSGFSPSKDDVLLRTQQTQLCTQHTNDDPGCVGSPSSNLVSICSQLGFSACSSANVQCLQSCCRAVCLGTGGGVDVIIPEEDCEDDLGGECVNSCGGDNILSPSGSGACDPSVLVCCDIG